MTINAINSPEEMSWIDGEFAKLTAVQTSPTMKPNASQPIGVRFLMQIAIW